MPERGGARQSGGGLKRRHSIVHGLEWPIRAGLNYSPGSAAGRRPRGRTFTGREYMRRTLWAAAGLALAAGLAFAVRAPAEAAETTGPARVTVTGEIIGSWCYLSEIMYALGSAHHQCAIWCARGGVPVGILGEDEKVYVVLKMQDDAAVLENPGIMKVQTNKVTVEGNLYERDSVRYLAIDKIVDNAGIVNHSHEEFDIQPFGE
jgi:hypothetical protein